MPAMLKHRADKNKMQKHTAVTSPAAIDPTFIPRVCNRRLLSERKQDRGRVEMLCDALFWLRAALLFGARTAVVY